MIVFAAAAVGTGLVRTVTTTYLPLLLADIREAPALIGLVMMVNSAAGFAMPLLVGRWSDRRHTPRHGRRPFIIVGSLLAACGLSAVALGQGTSYLVLTLAGTLAYVGVNIVMTAHRALVHDGFEAEDYAQGNGALEVASLLGGLVGLALGGLLTELALWAPFVLAAVGMLLLAWPTVRHLPVADPGKSEQPQHRPLRFYATTMIRPGVRALLAAEILWRSATPRCRSSSSSTRDASSTSHRLSRPSGSPPSRSAQGWSWSRQASSGTRACTSRFWGWASA